MSRTVAAVACLLSLCASADAIVGDAQPADWMIIRPALLVSSPRSGCSRVGLGRDLVLTAPHCVTSATNIKDAGPAGRRPDPQTTIPRPPLRPWSLTDAPPHRH